MNEAGFALSPLALRFEQFIASHRRAARAGPLEDAERLRKAGPRGAFGHIALGPQRRDFLGHCDVDELVEGHALCLGEFASLIEKRRLKSQRKIALPHGLFSNRLTVSPGDKTRIPKRSADRPKSRLLNVTIASAWPLTATSSTMSSSTSGKVGRQR